MGHSIWHGIYGMVGLKSEKTIAPFKRPEIAVSVFEEYTHLVYSCYDFLFRLKLYRMYISRNDFSILNRLSRYLSGV